MTAAAVSDPMAIANGTGQPVAMEHFDHSLKFDEALL